MEQLKNFFKVFKNYFNYLLKLEFKEFFINVIEIILLILLTAVIVYVPLGIIENLLLSVFKILKINKEIVLYIYSFVFEVIKALVAAYVFILFFNKRYENISEIRPKREDILYKKKEDNNDKKVEEVNSFKRNNVSDENDLNKEIEKKKKKY